MSLEMDKRTPAEGWHESEAERHDIDARTDEYKRAEKVLGKAVHPGALGRLFELWPQAVVEVKHYRDATRVTVACGARGVHGRSECSVHDQFNRKTGIRIAFLRALQKVREAEVDSQAGFGLAELP